jgi:hypothetical protein
MTRERDTAAKLLAEEYGDPLEDILQKRAYWQGIYDQQMAKPSRGHGSRDGKRLAKAEEMILRYNVEALPYMRPKYQAINHTNEAAPVPTVIRAPEVISDTQEWLEKYRPKSIANDQPPTAIESAVRTNQPGNRKCGRC